MPSDFPNDPESVMRGLFGSIVSAAEGGRDAATMWGALHEAANNWAAGVLGVTRAGQVSQAEIEDKARQLIGHVTVPIFNKYIGAAGDYLRARDTLHNLQEGAQITGQSIFTAPWATTVGNPAVPTRYRIRVQREIEVAGFTRIRRTEWATYELTGPLTSVEDALNQADMLFNQASYNSRATILNRLDYMIEAV